MKTGYVKLNVCEYENLILVNNELRMQRKKQEEKIEELEERIAELQEKLNEKSKVESEMREYIKALKEAKA